MQKSLSPASSRFFCCLHASFLVWLAATSFLVAGELTNDPLTRVSISSSPSPVGSGARAAGMGNAFVAVADDATAASWNPAGLVQLLRPEVSTVGLWRAHNEERDSHLHPEAATSDSWESLELNFASVAYPFAIGKTNFAVALNYQQAYDFEREIHFALNKQAASGAEGPILSQELNVTHEQSFRQDGQLGALGLGFAMEPMPNLLLGVNLNAWHSALMPSNAWSHSEHVESRGSVSVTTASGTSTSRFTQWFEEHQEREVARGMNAHVGMLWSFAPGWTLGAVVKTPLHAHLKAKIEGRSLSDQGTESTWTRTDDEVLEFPLSVGLGLAYRHTDELTLSLDVTRTSWDNFKLEKDNGDTINPISGEDFDESDVPALYAVRAGVEYLLVQDTTRVVPLRAGVFYDPEPLANGRRDAWGVSVGTGLVLRGMSIDAAYTYRWAEDVDVSGMDGTDVTEDRHLFMLSAIVYF